MNLSSDRRGDKSWLQRESQRWVEDGVLSAAQRDAILARYPEALPAVPGASMLRWLAWLVAASGVILLVAWNWDGLPDAVKVGGSLVASVGAYGASVAAFRRGQSARGDLLAFAGALLAGAVIASVTELLELPASNTRPWLAWSAVIALTAALTAAPVTTMTGAAVLTFWVMADSGRPQLSWAFLAVFPALAIALERRTHWSAAGAASLALGAWVTLTVVEAWRGSSALAGVALLAAGAALDGWSHWPEARRPAFARTTPALALIIVGWALLTGGAIVRSAPPAFAGTGAAVPVLLLLVALAGVAAWSWSPTRARLTGALVLVWLTMWLVVSPPSPPPSWWSWVWLVTASAGLVGVTLSAVREAAVTRDRGVLLAGIASIVTLILVHVTGGPNRFGRSALVLLVSGAVLWWMTTGPRTRPNDRSL